MKNNATCSMCGNDYRMGWTGTVNGCDTCLGNVRDADGYVYGPGEKHITLETFEDNGKLGVGGARDKAQQLARKLNGGN